MIGKSAGKRSLNIAHQFTLHQLRRNGAAIDSQKRGVPAITHAMNGLCDQLFARTAAAFQQDANIAPGSAFYRPEQSDEFLTLSDQAQLGIFFQQYIFWNRLVEIGFYQPVVI